MTFWQSLREAILESLFGRYQLEAWRQEKQRREECERIMQDNMRLQQMPHFVKEMENK